MSPEFGDNAVIILSAFAAGVLFALYMTGNL